MRNKDGRLRTIVDARPTNQIFKRPPSTVLCTSETFSKFEIELRDDIDPDSPEADVCYNSIQIYANICDVDNCFHRMRMPYLLSRYFAFDVLFRVEELGLVGELVGDGTLGRFLAGDLVVVASASLPMGFSWSLYIAQSINETIIQRAPGVCPSNLVNDESSAVVFRSYCRNRFHHYVYVDSLGLNGLSESFIAGSMDVAVAEYDRAGLLVYEKEACLVNLSCLLNGVEHVSEISKKRYDKLRSGIRGLLKRIFLCRIDIGSYCWSLYFCWSG